MANTDKDKQKKVDSDKATARKKAFYTKQREQAEEGAKEGDVRAKTTRDKIYKKIGRKPGPDAEDADQVNKAALGMLPTMLFPEGRLLGMGGKMAAGAAERMGAGKLVKGAMDAGESMMGKANLRGRGLTSGAAKTERAAAKNVTPKTAMQPARRSLNPAGPRKAGAVEEAGGKTRNALNPGKPKKGGASPESARSATMSRRQSAEAAKRKVDKNKIDVVAPRKNTAQAARKMQNDAASKANRKKKAA
jgi:hypothetical protein